MLTIHQAHVTLHYSCVCSDVSYSYVACAWALLYNAAMKNSVYERFIIHTFH